MSSFDTELNTDLFNRLEDNNWDTICLICVGSKPVEEFPENHKQVLDLINILSDKKLTKYLVNYFSVAIDCYKNREEAIVKVFVFITAVLRLDIKSDGKQLIALSENEPKFRTKIQIFNQIFELLKDNYKHLSLNQTFDFKTFIQNLLDSEEESNEELIYQCFDLILQIDYQLIDKQQNQLKQIITRSNPKDTETEDTKIQFLFTLFEVYFKARKAVKLHEILSQTSEDFDPRLLDSDRQLSQLYGRCILELPFGQSFDLWTLFLNKFSLKKQFFTKLLSILLQHIRCLDDSQPNHLRSQMDRLLIRTRKVLKTTDSVIRLFSDEKSVNILLELYFSFESIIILRMSYNRNYLSIEEFSQRLKPNDWFDLSLIYDFTDENLWKSLFENINYLSPKIIESLVKCLFQKFQFWKIIELNLDLNEDKKKVVNSSIDQLLTAIVTNFVTKNLNCFTLQQINAIISDLNSNDLCLLTDSLTSNAIEPTPDYQRFNIRQLLQMGTVWESIEFQTAFIGSFWRQLNKKFANRKRKLNEDLEKMDQIFESLTANNSIWFTFATNSPKMKNLDKLWSYIATISTETEQLIQSIDEQNAKKAKIPIDFLELFVDFVPLEYLLPANQMRCLLSLSLLLFAIDSSDEKKSNLFDVILDSILRIFDGVRSVWFFNFINPSVYIINVLKVLKNYKNHEKIRILMTRLVENFFRNTEQIDDLKNRLLENEDQISFEFLVMIETIVLKRSLHLLNMFVVPKNLEKLHQFCGPLSHQLSHTIHNQIKSRLMSETEVESIKSLNSMIIIDSFAAVFEFQVSKSTSDEEAINLKTKWRKLLSKLIVLSVNQLAQKSTNESCIKFLVLLCVNRKKLAHILPENFINKLWEVLCPVNERVVNELENTLKDVKMIDVFNQKENFKQLFETVRSKEEDNKNKFLESVSEQNIFAEDVKPLVIALIQCCSAEEFEQFLQSLIENLKSNDYSLVSYVLKIWIAVFESDFQLNDEKNALFSKYINDLFTFCANYCRKCNQNDYKLLSEFQINIKLPVLQIMRSTLHITKNVLMSSQLFLSYHSCIDARLDFYTSDPKVFTALFDAIYSVLNEALLQHKYAVISSISSFNLIVQKIMQTLMTVSEEHQYIGYEPIVRHDLEICSKNMDRLLTLMAALGIDYSVFATHLIASYVIQTERVSVHLIVKKNIMSGINRLLKLLSGSNAIEMIYCRLSESSRKIFKIIFDNYDKYYKFKGQI